MTGGFVNILKPPGMSSHDAVSLVRRTLGVKKAGHAGTLDPGAAGVLPVAVGRATRLIEYLDDVTKSYRAELVFGAETDSGDDLGEVVESAKDFEMPGDEAIYSATEKLTGKIIQTPPVYSAVRVNGRRACDLARENVSVTLPGREVTVHRLSVSAKGERSLLLDIDCSKGTYIRSICRDLGRLLGIPAAMAFLVRTRVGAFELSDTVTPEELRDAGEKAVLPPELFLGHIPRYELKEARVAPFLNGLPTRDEALGKGAGRLLVFGGGEFLGVGRYDESISSVVPEKIYMEMKLR